MEDPDNASLDDDGNDGASSCSDMGHDDVLPESIEADEEIRLHILGLSSYYTSVIECNFGAKISLLPTRYLPPGSIRLLYWQFRVVGSGCSYLHFWRVFREGWHNVLRFQSPSNHGQCDDCADYKESFGRSAQADSDQHRYEVARAYKDHITAVGRDRELETFLQSQRPLARQGCLAIHWEPWDSLYNLLSHFNRKDFRMIKLELSVADPFRTAWIRASGGSLKPELVYERCMMSGV